MTQSTEELGDLGPAPSTVAVDDAQTSSVVVHTAAIVGIRVCGCWTGERRIQPVGEHARGWADRWASGAAARTHPINQAPPGLSVTGLAATPPTGDHPMAGHPQRALDQRSAAKPPEQTSPRTLQDAARRKHRRVARDSPRHRGVSPTGRYALFRHELTGPVHPARWGRTADWFLGGRTVASRKALSESKREKRCCPEPLPAPRKACTRQR